MEEVVRILGIGIVAVALVLAGAAVAAGRSHTARHTGDRTEATFVAKGAKWVLTVGTGVVLLVLCVAASR
jgi:hypothetical protein